MISRMAPTLDVNQKVSMPWKGNNTNPPEPLRSFTNISIAGILLLVWELQTIPIWRSFSFRCPNMLLVCIFCNDRRLGMLGVANWVMFLFSLHYGNRDFTRSLFP
jgi:hypothetical protein